MKGLPQDRPTTALCWAHRFRDALGDAFAPATVSAYAADVEQAVGAFGLADAEDLDELTVPDVQAWVDGLSVQGARPATVSRKLSSLRLFVRWLRDQGVVREDATLGVRPPPRDRSVRPVDHRLVERTLRATLRLSRLPARDHALLLLLVDVGLKSGEVAGLSVEDFARDGCALRLPDRVVGLTERACEALSVHLGGRRTGPLFLTGRGGRFSRQALWRVLEQRALEARAERLSASALRRSLAARFAAEKSDPKSVAAYLGLSQRTAADLMRRATG